MDSQKKKKKKKKKKSLIYNDIDLFYGFTKKEEKLLTINKYKIQIQVFFFFFPRGIQTKGKHSKQDF